MLFLLNALHRLGNCLEQSLFFNPSYPIEPAERLSHLNVVLLRVYYQGRCNPGIYRDVEMYQWLLFADQKMSFNFLVLEYWIASVAPLVVVLAASNWRLAFYCRDSNGHRVFKFDRVFIFVLRILLVRWGGYWFLFCWFFSYYASGLGGRRFSRIHLWLFFAYARSTIQGLLPLTGSVFANFSAMPWKGFWIRRCSLLVHSLRSTSHRWIDSIFHWLHFLIFHLHLDLLKLHQKRLFEILLLLLLQILLYFLLFFLIFLLLLSYFKFVENFVLKRNLWLFHIFEFRLFKLWLFFWRRQKFKHIWARFFAVEFGALNFLFSLLAVALDLVYLPDFKFILGLLRVQRQQDFVQLLEILFSVKFPSKSVLNFRDRDLITQSFRICPLTLHYIRLKAVSYAKDQSLKTFNAQYGNFFLKMLMSSAVDLFDKTSHDVENVAEKIDLVDFSEPELCHQHNEVIKYKTDSLFFNTDTLSNLLVFFHDLYQIQLLWLRLKLTSAVAWWDWGFFKRLYAIMSSFGLRDHVPFSRLGCLKI